MESVIFKQKDLLKRLYGALSNYKESLKERVIVDCIEVRKETLENWRKDFENTHFEIVGAVDRQRKSLLPYFKENVYDEFIETFIEYKAMLRDDLRVICKDRVSEPAPPQTSFRTEQLFKNISMADKNYDKEWSQLKNLYENVETLGKPTCKTPMHNLTSKPASLNKIVQMSVDDKDNVNKIKENICVICNRPYAIYQCEQFERQSPFERVELVKANGLCFNCLNPNHTVKQCRQPSCCRSCGRRHHAMLHCERENQYVIPHESASHHSERSPNLKDQSNGKLVNNLVAPSTSENSRCRVLLADAMVRSKSCSEADEYEYDIFINKNLVKHPAVTSTIAQSTQFGLIFSGRIEENASSDKDIVSLNMQVKENELLKQVYEHERERDSSSNIMTKEDINNMEIKCENVNAKKNDINESDCHRVRLMNINYKRECAKDIPEEIEIDTNRRHTRLPIKIKYKDITMKSIKKLRKRLYNKRILYRRKKNMINNYDREKHVTLIEMNEQIAEMFAEKADGLQSQLLRAKRKKRLEYIKRENQMIAIVYRV